MEKLIGMDIGGTFVKAGLFSREGALEGTAKVPTGTLTTAADFARICGMLSELLGAHGASVDDVMGVGCDVPGPVDAAGDVGMLPNIALDVPGLKAALCTAFPQAKFAFANDANAAAVGEYWQGAGRGASIFVLVALGTGVGGGVVVDGQLLPGAFGTGGEIGHLTVERDEPAACGCGRHGCLEQYASATGVVRLYQAECAHRGMVPVQLSGPSDSLAVFEAMQAGDEAACAAVARMADYLGFAIAQVSTVVDPELFLIGGGMGAGFAQFADAL